MRTFENLQELETALASGTFLFKEEFFPAQFHCHDCGQYKPFKMSGGTGYDRDNEGNMFCYECGAKRTKADLIKRGKGHLYLTHNNLSNTWTLTDWTGKLSIPLQMTPKKSFHNIARNRYDVWFYWEGQNWHGVQYGDSTQVCHIKRAKH